MVSEGFSPAKGSKAVVVLSGVRLLVGSHGTPCRPVLVRQAACSDRCSV